MTVVKIMMIQGKDKAERVQNKLFKKGILKKYKLGVTTFVICPGNTNEWLVLQQKEEFLCR